MSSLTSNNLYYKNVNASLRESFFDFRAKHPVQAIEIDGTQWTFIDTNESHREAIPILILVGGLRVADAAYRAINVLEQTYRVIVPTYPALNTMSALTDGLIGILDSLGIDNVYVLSGSFGGLVAQILARRHQNRIAKLILSSTGTMSEQSIQSRKKTLRQLKFTPDWLARRITERRLFSIINPPSDTHDFWKAYLRELFSKRLNKQDIISTLACMIDFGEYFNITVDDLRDWKGDILIIGSEDDSTFGKSSNQQLLSLYPYAQVHQFENAGHSPAMTQQNNYFKRIIEFLQT